jgi:hypothetical protein
MAKMKPRVLLEATKATFAIASFITFNADEVITIDNIQWLSIHLYVVQKQRRILILLCVERMDVFATSTNIFGLMLKCD